MKKFLFVLAALIPLGSPVAPAAEVAPSGGESPEIGPGAVKSSLVWDKQKVEMKAKIAEKIVRTSYRFTNTGKDPVTLVDLIPSCGCVTTEVAKLVYAPGESGVIKVTLDLSIDDESETQDRTILVTSSDAPKDPTALRFIVHVPTAVEARPQGVDWKQGDKPVAKEVLVKSGPNIEQMKVHLESENGDFSVEIKPDAADQSYHVTIAPKSTAAVCYAQIRLVAESPSFPHPIVCEITARVKL